MAALFWPSIQVGFTAWQTVQALKAELGLDLGLFFLLKLNLCPAGLSMHLHGHGKNGSWVAGTPLMMGFKPRSLVSP